MTDETTKLKMNIEDDPECVFCFPFTVDTTSF